MKKTRLLLVLFVFLFQLSLKAQLSGTKTIGGTGADYSTIGSAINALHSLGVNGPVTFNIASNTYTEQLVLNTVSGASATNYIVFQSATGDSSDVIISVASTAIAVDNYVMKLNAVSFVTFKSISFVRTGTDVNATAIELSGVTNNISFQHCVFKNNSTSSSDTKSALVLAFNNTGNVFSAINYINNFFQNGSIGIYQLGLSSGTLSSDNSVVNNVFDNQYRWSIYLAYQHTPFIDSNIILSNSTYFDYTAIFLKYCNHALSVQNNMIQGSKGYGVRLENSIGQTNAGLVANNTISFTGAGAFGFSYSNSGNHNIYFNSAFLSGANSTGFAITGSTSNNNRFLNNAIQVGSGGKCMDVNLSTSFPFSDLDNNNYYSPSGNIGTWKNTSNLSTLAAWKTACGYDFSAINVNPNFVSATDLNVNIPSGMGRQGTASLTTPSVNVDIQGIPRHNSSPDIGAYEFSADDLAVGSILTLDTVCQGETVQFSYWLVNLGNATFNDFVDVGYAIGPLPFVINNTFINQLAAGDSILITFNPTSFPYSGSYSLSYKVDFTDKNILNNSKNRIMQVNPAPQLNWAVDTLVCGGNTITLDAGAGMTSYLWSNGATTQTIQVDSSGIGLGAKFFSVVIDLNGCELVDSILVNYIYCSSIGEHQSPVLISIFPNPTTGDIQFVIPNKPMTDGKISVLNKLGQEVLRLDYSPSIKLGELPPGVYFIQITDNNRRYFSKLILL